MTHNPAVGEKDTPAREWEAIVSACRRLVRQSPDASVTVQEVLDATSLSTRAFYRLFESKEDLLGSMLRADARVAEQRLLDAMGRAVTPGDAVVAWIDFWIGAIHSAGPFVRLRLVGRVRDPYVVDAVRQVWRDIDAASRAALALTIVAGVQRDSFAYGAPFDDARVFQSMVNELFDQRAFGAAVPKRAVMRAELIGLASRVLGTILPTTPMR